MIRYSLVLLLLPGLATSAPLLTGIVEDSNAQTIEMPRLPGGWQRRIDWMVPEGTSVEVGEVIVRLDPGDLITREEQVRTNLDQVRLSAERRIDEVRLQVMDSEAAVARAQSNMRIAELDAVIPEATIPRLDYERNQLALSTARKTLIRAEAELLNRRSELEDIIAETELEVRQAESNFERIERALAATEITAEKSGFMIYGENPFTGTKVFPGDTVFSGFEIAKVASRDDLQVRFWVHEADILEVRSGQRIQVSADAQGSTVFETELTWTSSQAVERQDWSDSGYFEALAQPTTALPGYITPGMSVMGVVSARETDR